MTEFEHAVLERLHLIESRLINIERRLFTNADEIPEMAIKAMLESTDYPISFHGRVHDDGDDIAARVTTELYRAIDKAARSGAFS